MNPINWQIFAAVVAFALVALGVWSAYELGRRHGADAGADEWARDAAIAERNAEVRGVRKGIDQQKAVYAAREKDAARRGPGGRFAKGRNP
jgi:hypothetical protein